jgi:hypothetical protein
MLDAQRDLADAEQENRVLRAEVADQDRLKETEADLEFAEDGRFWVRKSEKSHALIPYCPVCWGTEKQLVVMPGIATGAYKGSIASIAKPRGGNRPEFPTPFASIDNGYQRRRTETYARPT